MAEASESACRSKEGLATLPPLFNAKRILLTNLRLLDFHNFPPCIQSNEMFDRPNPEAFQLVMYFLFHKLDADSTQKKFLDCWPVYDRKTEASFRRVCSKWLESIAREDEEATFPGKIGPVLMFPHGNKFCGFLLQFSNYVMYKDLVKMAGPSEFIFRSPKDISDHPSLMKFVAANLQTAKRSNLQQYVGNLKEQYDNYKLWKENVDHQIDLGRKLDEEINVMKQKQKELEEQIGARTEEKLTEETNKTEEKLRKLAAIWKTIKGASEADEVHWDTVSSVTACTSTSTQLDGKKLSVDVSDILKRTMGLQLEQNTLQNLRDGENISLLSLTRIFQTSLKLYFGEIKRHDPFPEVKKVSSLLNKPDDTLNKLEDLKSDLLARKQELQLAIEKLEKKLPDLSSLEDINSKTLSSLHILDPLHQNVAENKLEDEVLDFGSPFPTPSGSGVSPLTSNVSLSLPSGRLFSRRCSPLLNDPLKSPNLLQSRNGHYSGTSTDMGSPKVPVIETGFRQKRQWTKVQLAGGLPTDRSTIKGTNLEKQLYPSYDKNTENRTTVECKQNEASGNYFEMTPKGHSSGVSYEKIGNEVECFGVESISECYTSSPTYTKEQSAIEDPCTFEALNEDIVQNLKDMCLLSGEISFDILNSEGINDQYLDYLVPSTPSPK